MLIEALPARPSRATSIVVSALLVVAWAVVRLLIFDTVPFPLAYVIPLLVCVWTRDRDALWIMAAAFVGLHVLKLAVFVPPGTMTGPEIVSDLGATFANLIIGAVAVDLIIGLLDRVETMLAAARAQAEELEAQGEELAQQNEELTEQSEALSQQADQLSRQNDELHAANARVGVLNDELLRKERLLETLLDAARFDDQARVPVTHVTSAALELLGELGALAVTFIRTPDGVAVDAAAVWDPAAGTPQPLAAGAWWPDPSDPFAGMVLQQNRTAALTDTALRPDLVLPAVPGLPPLRAVLASPIRVAGHADGVLAVYSPRVHEWTSEQFALVQWLADTGGRAWHAQRVQAELRDADRRKSEFLATLSHELRNPLAPIRYSLRLLEQGQSNDAVVRIMQRQVRHLVRLVDDLLDATRLTSGKIQLRRALADLALVVRDAVEALEPEVAAGRHELDVRLPDQPVWLDADADRLAQVVANLMSNATRYTPPGGRITVSVTAADGQARLVVADTGVGVEPRDIPRMFQMFAQLSGPGSGGLGIGLAIVRGIVELHGGRLEAHSDGPGRGCTITVTLATTDQVAPSPTVAAAPIAPLPPTTVLVVDDNVDAATTMAALFELHGHTVWVAHDAAAAVAAARTHAPAVGVLDIGLPGVSGYELAAQLRADRSTAHMRLVAVTGWGQDADRQRASAAGFDAHFTKPAEPDVILAALASKSPRATEA